MPNSGDATGALDPDATKVVILEAFNDNGVPIADVCRSYVGTFDPTKQPAVFVSFYVRDGRPIPFPDGEEPRLADRKVNVMLTQVPNNMGGWCWHGWGSVEQWAPDPEGASDWIWAALWQHHRDGWGPSNPPPASAYAAIEDVKKVLQIANGVIGAMLQEPPLELPVVPSMPTPVMPALTPPAAGGDPAPVNTGDASYNFDRDAAIASVVQAFKDNGVPIDGLYVWESPGGGAPNLTVSVYVRDGKPFQWAPAEPLPGDQKIQVVVSVEGNDTGGWQWYVRGSISQYEGPGGTGGWGIWNDAAHWAPNYDPSTAPATVYDAVERVKQHLGIGNGMITPVRPVPPAPEPVVTSSVATSPVVAVAPEGPNVGRIAAIGAAVVIGLGAVGGTVYALTHSGKPTAAVGSGGQPTNQSGNATNQSGNATDDLNRIIASLSNSSALQADSVEVLNQGGVSSTFNIHLIASRNPFMVYTKASQPGMPTTESLTDSKGTICQVRSGQHFSFAGQAPAADAYNHVLPIGNVALPFSVKREADGQLPGDPSGTKSLRRYLLEGIATPPGPPDRAYSSKTLEVFTNDDIPVAMILDYQFKDPGANGGVAGEDMTTYSHIALLPTVTFPPVCAT